MRNMRFALAALFALCFAVSAALAYDAAIVGQAERALESFKAELGSIAIELQNPALTESQLTENKTKLEDFRAQALDQSSRLTVPISEIRQQLESLGTVAAEGKSEPPGVAAERATLQASLDRIQSVKSRLDVVAVEAEQLAGRVSALQRNQFFQRIFESGRSILNPLLWFDTGLGLGVLLTRLAGLFSNWWSEVNGIANPLGLGLIPVFVALCVMGYGALRRWVRLWTRSYAAVKRAPDDIGRIWRIVRGQITTVAALFILLVPIFLALQLSGYITPRFGLVLNAAVDLVAGTTIYFMLARRLAAPDLAAWRIIDIDDTAAARLPILVGLTAFVSVANEKLVELADALFLPVNYTIGQSAMAALAMFVLLTLVVVTLRNQSGFSDGLAGRRIYFKWAAAFTPLVWLLIATGVGALLFGYLALANYIAQQLFQTGMLVTALFLLHHLSDAAVAASFDPQSGFGKFFRRVTGMGERAIERLGLAFRTVVDLLLMLAGLPLLFLLWTVTWVDFRSLVNTAVFGVKLGEITISPWSMAIVLLILVSGIVITNLIIRWLDRRILTETRIDKGVQDSIRKGASYAGYVAAAGMALSAAGLEFSNIAIIAGALGVGIGFGLQSIVNNFISGLILLAERPIRVGDWVVLDAGQGLVKRINVRATEIETFDSCSIIVPNLMLITGVVKNWTHGDTIGQFMVAVTVDLHSDADLVRRLLLDAAREHPKVMTFPEPGVTLARIASTGLDFELRGSVANVFDAGHVASDLRFKLLAAFREKGITIPQPLAVLQGPQK
jgi:potassium-dependent mechanosensitive channel